MKEVKLGGSLMVNWNDVYERGAQWAHLKPSQHMAAFLSHLPPSSIVLDIGCGNGRNLPTLLMAGHEAYGIDISEEAMAKVDPSLREISNLHLQIGDVHNLFFPDNFFDGVHAGYILQHTRMDIACAEIARVLKPSGLAYLVILEVTKHDTACPYDIALQSEDVQQSLNGAFVVESLTYDEYEETDDYGPHFHRRLTAICRKQS